MNDYRPTIGIVPTDKYKKAKQDFIHAMNSMRELTQEEQQMLAAELLQMYWFSTMLHLFQR